MYGDFILIERSSKLEKAERVFVGDLTGKDERWLRDTLFSHPEVLPIHQIDTAYGPLVPLCTELRTAHGLIDALFVDGHGQLTIVECKLRKNSEARREVVAQTLDYVSALRGWSYVDLQEKVATKGKPVDLFEAVHAAGDARLTKQQFREALSRSLHDSRFLVLIVGDGIHESLQSLTDLVNLRATSEFSLGLIEIALYRVNAGELLMHPRVLAKTAIIERRIIHIDSGNFTEENRKDEVDPPPPRSDKGRLKEWWQPILDMKFDDPEQEPPFWVGTNNAVLNTPFPKVQIKAFANKHSKIGVFLSGPEGPASVKPIRKLIERERASLKYDLPVGTDIDPKASWPITLYTSEFEYDDDKRVWLIKMLNTFVNVLRPRLKEWSSETGS